jgi:hypothetical protein
MSTSTLMIIMSRGYFSYSSFLSSCCSSSHPPPSDDQNENNLYTIIMVHSSLSPIDHTPHFFALPVLAIMIMRTILSTGRISFTFTLTLFPFPEAVEDSQVLLLLASSLVSVPVCTCRSKLLKTENVGAHSKSTSQSIQTA